MSTDIRDAWDRDRQPTARSAATDLDKLSKSAAGVEAQASGTLPEAEDTAALGAEGERLEARPPSIRRPFSA